MNASDTIPASTWVSAAAVRFAMFFAGWLVLTQGKLSDLVFVALLLAATTAISLWSVPPTAKLWRVHPVHLVAFFPYFLWCALRGGFDVARRVFPVKMPIDPTFVHVPVSASRRQKYLLALVVSLLPGTASCEIVGDTLVVHCLDRSLPVADEIKDICARIKRTVD